MLDTQARHATETSLFPEAPYRRALVVANPVAGRGQGAAAAGDLMAGLERRGVPAELFLSCARGEARARVRCLEPDADLVVSVGGDGTLAEVLSGMLDPKIPIGVLPLGTANVLSLDLGLPRDVDRALEVIFAKRSTAIDTYKVNGHLGFLVTGVGFDGMCVRELEARRRGPITPWSYVRAAARAVQHYRPPALSVEIDGATVPGTFGQVLVSNVVHYAGLMRLASDARLDDGLFEVYLFERSGRAALVPYAVRGLLGLLPGGSCRMQRARTVRITSPEPVPYQVDGDYRGETPVDFALHATQYRLLVPYQSGKDQGPGEERHHG